MMRFSGLRVLNPKSNNRQPNSGVSLTWYEASYTVWPIVPPDESRTRPMEQVRVSGPSPKLAEFSRRITAVFAVVYKHHVC